MGLFNSIRCTYGERCVMILRQLTKETKESTNILGKIHFLRECVQRKILPRSLWFSLPGGFKYDLQMKRKIGKMMLKKQIKLHYAQLQRLDRDMMVRRQCLTRLIDNETDRARVFDFIEMTRQNTKQQHDLKEQSRLLRLSTLHDSNYSADKGSTLQRGSKRINLPTEEKVVVNLSDKVLDKHETDLLKKGLNFAVAPKKVPISDIIAETETEISKLKGDRKEWVRTEVKNAIKRTRLKSNLTNEEENALRRLKGETSIKILKADKGNATVVLNTTDYMDKLENLITNGPYEKLRSDPGKRLRGELHSMLMTAVNENRITRFFMLQMCPTHYQTPHFYGLPKIHKTGVPLRPIVSMIGAFHSNLAKYLNNVIKPYATNGPSFIKNSTDAISKLSQVSDLHEGIILSLDVVSLFTKIPLDESIEAIQKCLDDDHSLSSRTNFNRQELSILLRFCLTCCYFQHRDDLYRQYDGVAMGSSLSCSVANIFMFHFEKKAEEEMQSRGITWPAQYLRYVDDTFLHWKGTEQELDLFIQTLNSVRSCIQFTQEREENDSLAFLDIKIHRKAGKVDFAIHRKDTHTNLYLNRKSCHPRSTFNGIVTTLSHRAKNICSQNMLKGELKDLHDIFIHNGFPEREANRVFRMRLNSRTQGEDLQHRQRPIPDCIFPYVPGLYESIRSILNKVNLKTGYKPIRTIKQELMKKRPAPAKQHGIIYNVECGDCAWKYIGESGRLVEERIEEHKRAVKRFDTCSEISNHVLNEDHQMEWSSHAILEREENYQHRIVKEAIWTRRKKSGNRVKFVLSTAWDDIM